MSEKHELRLEIWEAIRVAGVGRFPGIVGRIPNFTGAEDAARSLASTAEWQAAAVVKANPDSPQWPVRTRALADGKTVYMAVPKLADAKPFWRLDPDAITVPPRAASSIKGAMIHGEPVAIEEMEPIDLLVCGSVAVDAAGSRLGKGGGYSDLEFAIGVAEGLIGDHTITATTVHDVQLIDEGRIPMIEHDVPVDLIVTPHDVIRTSGQERPHGVMWEHLSSEKVDAIPVLAARRP